jgi:hypothetical protein
VRVAHHEREWHLTDELGGAGHLRNGQNRDSDKHQREHPLCVFHKSPLQIVFEPGESDGILHHDSQKVHGGALKLYETV